MRHRFLLLGLALLASCSNADQQAIETTTDDGVSVVLNICNDEFPQPWIIDRNLVAGVSYGDSLYMFRNPHAAIVLESGDWVVLDSIPLEFRVYDETGSYVRSFGQQGRGPTDLQWSNVVGRLHSIGNNRFELWSDWPVRIQVWNALGQLEELKTMQPDHPFLAGMYPRILEVIGDNLFALIWTSQRDDQNRSVSLSHLIASDWRGTFIDTLYSIEHSPMDVGTGMAQAAFDYPARDQILTTSDGRLFISSWEEDWIHEIDPTKGHEIRRFRLEHEPMTIPAYWIENYRTRYGNSFAEGIDWLRRRTWFLKLREGPDNEIWVDRRHEPLEDGTWPYDVFDSKGRYRGRIYNQGPLSFSGLNGGRESLSIGTNEDGAPVLMRYRYLSSR